MTTQFWGRVTRLNPELVVDGNAYSVGVIFRDGAAAFSGTTPVVSSATIHRVDDIGGGVRRVVFRRGVQTSTTIEPPLAVGAGAREVERRHSTGGNVCATHDAQRIYSARNDRSFSGADWRDRVVPGDRMVWRGKGFNVATANAYADEPDEVDWTTDNGPTVWYPGTAVNDLTLNPENAEVVFPGDSDHPGTEVVLVSGASEYPLTRQIFTNAAGDSDPDEWPNAATFSGSDRYYFQPDALRFYIPTGAGTLGSTSPRSIRCRYYVRGLASATPGASWPVVISATSASGYGSTDDALGMACQHMSGDGTAVFWIGSGAGSLEWRLPPVESDSIFAAVRWNSSGGFVESRARQTVGGTTTTASLSASFTFPFQCRVAKSGNVFTFGARQTETDSWTTLATITLTNVGNGTSTGVDSGAVCLATTGVLRVSNFTGQAVATATGNASVSISVMRQTTWSNVQFLLSVELPTSEAVTEIRNLSTDSVMSTGGATGRNKYVLSGSTLFVLSESAGDTIRVTQAATAVAPAAPGYGPEARNIPNMVNAADPELPEDTSANRLNWRDAVEILDPDGEFEATSGDVVSFNRGPVFDASDPPAIYYDTRNGGGDWTLLDPSNYVLRSADGMLLLRSSWVSANVPAGARLCLKAQGPAYRRHTMPRAIHLQMMGRAVEALGELDVLVGVGGAGGAFALQANCGLAVGTVQGCVSGSTETVSAVWGSQRSALLYYVNGAISAGKSAWPITIASLTSGPQYADMRNGFFDDTYSTGGCDGTLDTRNDYVEDECPVFALLGETYPGDTGADIRFGSPIPLATSIEAAGELKYSGVPFIPAQVLANVPQGSTIQLARMRIRINGLRRWQWSRSKSSNYGAVTSDTITINGETFNIGDAIDLEELAETSGNIAWGLMARRVESRSITVDCVPSGGSLIAYGLPEPAPGGGTHTALGVTVASSTGFTDGAWTVADVTGALRALLGDRNSPNTVYYLYPTIGPSPDVEPDSIAALCASQLPAYSIETETSGGILTGWRATCSGTWFAADSIEFGNCWARFAAPSWFDQITLPAPRPEFKTP